MGFSPFFIFRFLWQNRKRTSFVVLGIMLSAMLLTLMCCIFTTITGCRYNAGTAVGGYAHGIVTMPSGYAQDAAKNAFFEQADIYSCVSFFNTGFDGGNEKCQLVLDCPFAEFVSVNPNDTQLSSRYTNNIVDGRLPLSENEIAIPEMLLPAFGFPETGSEISLVFEFSEEGREAASLNYTLCGVTSESSMLIYGGIKLPPEIEVMSTDELFIRFKKSVESTEDAVEQVLRNLGLNSDEYTYDENITITRSDFIGRTARLSGVKLGIALAGAMLVLLLCCRMVVDCSFEIVARECIRQFGILKTTGISSAQLNSVAMLQASVLSAVGIIPGIGGGLLLSAVLYRLISGTELFDSIVCAVGDNAQGCFRLYISIPLMLLIAVVVLLWTIFSSLGVMRRVKRMTPLQAISGGDDDSSPLPAKGPDGRLKRLLGYTGTLAAYNVKKNPSRCRAAILSVAVSITIYAVAATGLSAVGRLSAPDSVETAKPDFEVTFIKAPDEVRATLESSGYFSRISALAVSTASDDGLCGFSLAIKDKARYRPAREFLFGMDGLSRVVDRNKDSSPQELVSMMISFLINSFVILIALVSAANVLNTVSASIYSCRRECAVLRAVGMSDMQLLRVILLENLICTLKAALFAAITVVVIVLVSDGICTVLFSGLPIDPLGTVISALEDVFTAFITASFIACLSSLIPFRGIISGEISRELKYE